MNNRKLEASPNVLTHKMKIQELVLRKGLNMLEPEMEERLKEPGYGS